MMETAKDRLRLIGTSRQRVDALAKAKGEHLFPSDNAMQNALWVRVVRSARAHARLIGVETRAAEEMEGVACVLTAADVPGTNRYGLVIADQPALCEDVVRYEGEAIAIIAAEADEIARAACEKVEVLYEDLPVIADAATAESAISLHPDGNTCSTVALGFGDVAASEASCDHMVEVAYTTNRQEHGFLETEAGTSWIDETGRLTLSVGAQNPFNDRRQIAAALNLAEDKIRVLNPMMGGAFGGKEDCNVHIPLALVTIRTGRPARFMYDRRESLLSGVKRHEFNIAYRIGADSTGKLKSAKVNLRADAGAYATLSAAVLAQAAEHASGPYVYEASEITGKAVYTNNGIASAYRGFGIPQTSIGVEQAMDELARRTGLSPFEVRRRNLIHEGEMAAAGFIMAADTALAAMLDAAESGPLWGDRQEAKSRAPSWVRRGIGVSAIWQGYGLGSGLEKGATVHVSLNDAGRYHLEVGTPDLGAGNLTAFLQIAAENLNTTIENFEYVAGDSLGPNSGSSHASRTIYIVGNAVARAAQELRVRILDHALAGRDNVTVELEAHHVVLSGARIALADIARDMAGTKVVESFVPVSPKPVHFGIPHAGYSYWVQVLGVDVDIHTGEVAVTDVENYLDTGRTINPDGVRAQCEGGFAQGLGYALYENSIYTDGRLRNPSLANYIIPSVKDMPPRMTNTIFETPDHTSPLGVRGIAEISLSPVAATVANAVHDAIGTRFSQFPILPEAVLNAIHGEA
ncbi:CO or xanthine dehydrogenase, Mo-binding subunit [Salinihabitans flavidus]|uniref:CO or xanthine dehydrogenase, Mo-binding subunit n=1 Tax=Salinihabitans flavidus TaxID=569882 RepID=A0A1H8W580_9RHOB|nr:xanthine dehydrogenase family protein molybdopterin-binding subunit [Salinihabitans flavidus]SEP22607.1 CO or xanthine dehydrogenase, Mo-binding subunit [Salinihabitans flavidus]